MQQAHCWVIAFDIREGVDRTDLRRLMRVWTDNARRMTKGIAPVADLEGEMLEAPANLTITIRKRVQGITVSAWTLHPTHLIQVCLYCAVRSLLYRTGSEPSSLNQQRMKT